MNRRTATNAMGTRFELVLAGEDEFFLHAVAEEAVEEIQHWHRLLNYFAPDSIVAAINRSAARAPVRVDSETFALLLACGALHESTHGAFDITIAPLMRYLGFRDGQMDDDAGPPPFGMSNIQLDERSRTIAFRTPGVEIDLGGIAKGWAIDRVVEILRSHDIRCALVHGGTSTAFGLGAPPDTDGWRIRIQNPESVDDAPPFVCLNDMALSVSAPHGRVVDSPDGPRGHVIDPRSGCPADAAFSAAVVTSAATNADAWSTAMIVLESLPAGLENTLSCLRCAASPDGGRWTSTSDPYHAFTSQHVERP